MTTKTDLASGLQFAEVAENPTLLIVDDSRLMRYTLKKMLSDDFELLEAVDGEDGWEKLLANPGIQGVFSDLSMPNLDGYGLLKRIRNADDPGISKLPFIVITGKEGDDQSLLEEARAHGANDVVSKPFKSEDIINKTKSFIAVEPQSDAARLQDTAAETLPNTPSVAEEAARQAAEHAEAQRKAEEAARQAAENAEAQRRKAEAEAQRKAEEAARQAAEHAEAQRREAEAEAQRKAEEAARQAAEQAEAQRRKAEAEAQRKAEEAARQAAEQAEAQRREAEAEAQRKAEEAARQAAEQAEAQRREAEAEVQRAAEESARLAEEETAHTSEDDSSPAVYNDESRRTPEVVTDFSVEPEVSDEDQQSFDQETTEPQPFTPLTRFCVRIALPFLDISNRLLGLQKDEQLAALRKRLK